MSYTFTADERAQILAAINASSGLSWNLDSAGYEASDLAGTNAVPLYQTLSNLIATKLETPSAFDIATLADLKNAKLWLDVAIGANGGTGMHSAFIRAFTNEQGLLRLGSTFSEQQMQHASNVVARNVANGLLLGDAADNLAPWTVPRIDQIAGLGRVNTNGRTVYQGRYLLAWKSRPSSSHVLNIAFPPNAATSA